MGRSWATSELFNLTYFAVLGSVLILGQLLSNWFNSKLASLISSELTKLKQTKFQPGHGFSVLGFLWRLPLLMFVSLLIRTNLEDTSLVHLVLAAVIFLMTYYVPYKFKDALIRASGID